MSADESPDDWDYADEFAFDGGEQGCGDLLLDLQFHCRQLPPGTAVRVHAVDAGAPLEIPAWCRLTKNLLVDSSHPFYLIQTKS